MALGGSGPLGLNESEAHKIPLIQFFSSLRSLDASSVDVIIELGVASQVIAKTLVVPSLLSWLVDVYPIFNDVNPYNGHVNPYY